MTVAWSVALSETTRVVTKATTMVDMTVVCSVNLWADLTAFQWVVGKAASMVAKTVAWKDEAKVDLTVL
jgi:hypothetical protein